MSIFPPPPSLRPIAKLEVENLSTNPPIKDEYFLLPDQTMRFGRDPQSNDYTYPSASLSRNHLEFYSVSIDDGAEPMVYVRDRQSANGTFVNNTLIGQGSAVTVGRLLEDGDTVTVKPNWHFRVKLLAMKRTPLTLLQLTETALFKAQYTISDIVLGSGVSTTVRLAHDVKTNQQLACKIYDLHARRDEGRHAEIRELTRALRLMTQVNHLNISSFQRAYRSQHTLFVFEELSAGGDLFSLVSGCVRITELEVRWALRQLLVGLKYLHDKGIAHRDIKMENVLLCVCPNLAHRLALTDLGHADVLIKGRQFSSLAGTRGWQAPELFRKGRTHGLPVDMWSMGIMAVHLLLGRVESKMMAHIENTLPKKPNIDSLDFKTVFGEIYQTRHEVPSDGPREDFIRRCLDCEASTRMTVDEALRHSYINEPAGVRQLFESREEENAAGWMGRSEQTDLVRSLPDVLLAPQPAAAFIKGKKERPKLRINIVDKRSAKNNSSEAEKSPYFGKVTKAAEGKRARDNEPEEQEEEEERTKRRKVVICLD